MGDHLSALQLDTVAAGLQVEMPVTAHLSSCAACQAKLEAVKAERASLQQSPRFGAMLEQLAPAAPRRLIPRWAPVALALAATLLVIVSTQFLRPDDGTILKGAQTIELLEDGKPVTTARVGARITLAVGATGQKGVAAFAVDDKGEVEVLLPSTQVPAGARVTVGNVFEVTEGSITVFACFGDHPLDVEALKPKLSANPRCVKTRLEVVP